jgi:hypothetical protein
LDFRALKKNGDTFVMSPPNIDWTHEREWRVQGDINLRKVPRLYVIVWSAQEAKEIANSAYAVAVPSSWRFPNGASRHDAVGTSQTSLKIDELGSNI